MKNELGIKGIGWGELNKIKKIQFGHCNILFNSNHSASTKVAHRKRAEECVQKKRKDLVTRNEHLAHKRSKNGPRQPEAKTRCHQSGKGDSQRNLRK